MDSLILPIISILASVGIFGWLGKLLVARYERANSRKEYILKNTKFEVKIETIKVGDMYRSTPRTIVKPFIYPVSDSTRCHMDIDDCGHLKDCHTRPFLCRKCRKILSSVFKYNRAFLPLVDKDFANLCK